MIISDRTPDEINDLLDRCLDSEASGKSSYPAMTYEMGIEAALTWLDGGDHPLDD